MREEMKVPGGWVVKRLGEVCEINPKIPNKESISDDLEVQFLPMKLVEEIIGKCHLSEIKKYGVVKKGYTPFIDDDVIFAKVTPCMENGKIAVVNNLKNKIGFGSSEFHVLRASDNISSKYIFYFVVQNKFRHEAAKEMTGAVGLRRVPKQFLENYSIPLPPLPEQRAIVAKIEELLSDLENGKQQLQSAQQQLKIYRQSLLKAAFEGKLTNKNVKEGELPKGWKWVTPTDIASPEKYSIGIGPFGSNLKVCDYTSSGVPLVFVKNITRNDFALVPRFVSIEKFIELKAHSAKPLDILITKMGDPPGDCAIYPTSAPEAIITADCLKFRINEKLANRQFVFYSLQTLAVKKQFGLITKGVAQKKISTQRFRNILLPLPPLEEQQRIVFELESKLTICDNISATITKSLAQAETLRQSILKKAFEGKLV